MKDISLGPLEQEVMQSVWRLGDSTTRDIYNYLGKKRKLAYNTIQTIMVRLQKKGLLKRQLKGKAFVYQAVSPKKTTLRSAIHKSMQSFRDQFGDEALIAFVDGLDDISTQTRLKLIKKLRQQ